VWLVWRGVLGLAVALGSGRACRFERDECKVRMCFFGWSSMGQFS